MVSTVVWDIGLVVSVIDIEKFPLILYYIKDIYEEFTRPADLLATSSKHAWETFSRPNR
jgi:hypothetical protein